MSKNVRLFFLWAIFYSQSFHEVAFAEENRTLYIYQDTDLSNHIESSEAIQYGIELAFDEIGNEIEGYKIAFKYLDHRGNVVRSKKNYKAFLNDPDALVMYSGIHSPPLIKNLSFINESKALTLVPWAAGGPITRYPSEQNWVFRLSIDDTRAAGVMVDFAMKQKSCRAPHLLLEDTPWGDSNLKNMTQALRAYDIATPNVTRFSWNMQSNGARAMLRKITASNSDCIILVANAVEGAVIAKAMVGMPSAQRLPIISHWGITGGNFHEKVDAKQRRYLDLSFIQTCFSFTHKKQSTFSKGVFDRLVQYSNHRIKKPKDLKSAVGFIHAYDLSKLLIQAIHQAGLTGDMERDRNAIRLALESLQEPVEGLVKTYSKPFATFDKENNFNAHEALGKENYCMGYYGVHNEILLIEKN